MAARALDGVAAIAVTRGQHERAARLLGAAWGLDEMSGAYLEPRHRERQTRALAATRAALGEASFESARATGKMLTLEAAIAETLSMAEESDAVENSSVAPSPRSPVSATLTAPYDRFGLSRREREVLDLLIRRFTAVEIAEALFISARTVEGHVASIYNKLGVASRREAIAVAAGHGLV